MGQLDGTRPDPGARATIGGQIAAALRAQIAKGIYGPGDRLPSTRALAAERGVSRTTVTAAYEQLLAEGYLESRPGARTVVARGLRPVPDRPVPDRAMPSRAMPAPALLSGFGQRLAALPAPPPPAPGRLIADFRFGDLAAEDFPLLAWKRALNGALLRRAGWLGYGEPAGSPALRAALAAYLWRARGLRCEAGQIVVVNGSQQGLDLCARLALDPGARAVVEDPGYLMARHAFLAAGAALVPVPVDEDGLRTDALPRDGGTRITHVTPSHQFPLGGVLSAPRRGALLAWARREGAWIVEDDHDSEYRFDIDPIPPLAALGDAAGVIYLGTVSKTLSPALRLGYLVLPAGLVEPFRAAKRMADRHTPSLEQEALAELIAGGGYERHVRRMRRRNGERRAALLSALSACLGGRVTVAGADAGLHVVVWFDDVPRALEGALIAAARAAGVGLYPVTPLYDAEGSAARPDCAGIVMGYGGLNPNAIAAAVRGLVQVVKGIVSPAMR